MSAPRPEPDSIWTMLLLAGVLFLGGCIFWFMLKSPLLEGMRWVRYGELLPISLFSHRYDGCLYWLRHVPFDDANVPAAPTTTIYDATNQCFGASYLMTLPAKEQLPYYNLTATGLGAIGHMVTYYYRWIYCLIFLWLGYYIIFISPRNKFRVRYDLESFIKAQVKMWPVITPIVNFNPIKSSARVPGSAIPDKLPLFAEALSPEEWISFHRIPVSNSIVDREATRQALQQQLGPRWSGIDGQKIYILALLAAFALKGTQKREESDDLLGRMSVGWTPTGGYTISSEVRSEVLKILKDPAIGGKALEIANQHAYRTTALLGVLRWARAMGGVLAPAQFLWLRGTDRVLWYALNNLGRRSFHAEGAGALAHFMAEQNAKKPLPIPRIDTALVTINQYLAERGQPIPPHEGDPARS